MSKWPSFMRFLQEIQETPDHTNRQQMVDELLSSRQEWPWIDGRVATFVYSRVGAQSVALNLDIIPNDPPFEYMYNIEGTTLWYVQKTFAADDLLDYMIAVDDPGTPLSKEPNIMGRIANHWQVDTRNSLRMSTAQMEVSILRMPKARPFPDWQSMPVMRGKIYEHLFDSVQMEATNRKLWVYTPPHYDQSENEYYPLLILLDGQWMVGPLQVPYIVDVLSKHGRVKPMVIAMLQSSAPQQRMSNLVSNDKHYAALLIELLPFLQSHYRINPVDLGIGGVGISAVAAAHSALRNPAVFSHLMLLSPPLGKGPAQEQLETYAERFNTAPALPRRIFQSVGRYEMRTRFYLPALALSKILERRQQQRNDIDYRFVETGSGHGLVAFKSILPEALAHIFPVTAETN